MPVKREDPGSNPGGSNMWGAIAQLGERDVSSTFCRRNFFDAKAFANFSPGFALKLWVNVFDND